MSTDILINNVNLSLDARDDTPALSASQEAHKADALLQTILPPHTTNMSAFECDDAGIDHHANLADYSELDTEIAKAPERHSVEIGLPKHFSQDQVTKTQLTKTRRPRQRHTRGKHVRRLRQDHWQMAQPRSRPSESIPLITHPARS